MVCSNRDKSTILLTISGLTGGLAAPLLAAGAGAVIGGAGAAALGSVAGVAIIGSLFGVAGAGLGGKGKAFLKKIKVKETMVRIAIIFAAFSF